MNKTTEGWNKLYRHQPTSDRSRVKLRVTEKSKARSWWAAHAAPESRDGFMAAAKSREDERRHLEDLRIAAQSRPSATIAFWKF